MIAGKLRAMEPWLSAVNACATILLTGFIGLYVGLPSNVAVQAQRIHTLEVNSAAALSRIGALEVGGTAVARDHVSNDDMRQAQVDSRLFEHDKILRQIEVNQATIIERLTNLQKILEDHSRLDSTRKDPKA